MLIDDEKNLIWENVLVRLKREFANYHKYANFKGAPGRGRRVVFTTLLAALIAAPDGMLSPGVNSSASDGNVLEAINLCLNVFDQVSAR